MAGFACCWSNFTNHIIWGAVIAWHGKRLVIWIVINTKACNRFGDTKNLDFFFIMWWRTSRGWWEISFGVRNQSGYSVRILMGNSLTPGIVNSWELFGNMRWNLRTVSVVINRFAVHSTAWAYWRWPLHRTLITERTSTHVRTLRPTNCNWSFN